MRHRPQILGFAVLFAVVAGCNGDDGEDPAEMEDVAEFPGEPQGPGEDEERRLPPEDGTDDEQAEGGEEITGEQAAEVELAVASGELGEYLTGGGGVAVYGSTRDAGGDSHCTGECLEQWPIVSTSGSGLEFGEGVDEGLVSTIEREDGTLQLTYGGYPLHRYVGDLDGATTGHGVDATWSLVHPDGELLLERDSV